MSEVEVLEKELDALGDLIADARLSLQYHKQNAHAADTRLGELLKRQKAIQAALPKPTEPRVWKSLSDVPVGTIVGSKYGTWIYIPAQGEGWYILPEDLDDLPDSGWNILSSYDSEGPFTEVLNPEGILDA